MTATSRPELAHGRVCLLVAVAEPTSALLDCLRSLAQSTDPGVAVVIASAEPREALDELLEGIEVAEHVWLAPQRSGTLTAVVEGALEDLWPSDVVLLSEPLLVTAGWLDRLREAAYVDTNIASASALSDRGGTLAASDAMAPARPLEEVAAELAERTLRLRPRLNVAVPPCTYLRRDALELVDGLERQLELRWAIADFAQRCLLDGLGHVLADDVVVGRLGARPTDDAAPPLLREDHPNLEPGPLPTDSGTSVEAIAASGVLPRALRALRRDRGALAVTLDARALGANITGTQRQILELIRALAATAAVHMRLLVAPDADQPVLEELRSLPGVEVLRTDEITRSTAPSPVFHRPQQVFEPNDVRFAVRLGSRLVINQLDLIAYRNPGYHANAAAWHSHRRVGRQALAAADCIVVLSRHTREDLLSDELADSARIRVVPPGLDHPRQERSQPPAGLPHKDTTGQSEYLLCLGTDFRHKNRVFALRLLRELRSTHRWNGRLVFAGTHIPHGSSAELEREYLSRHEELREAVTDLGSVVRAGEGLAHGARRARSSTRPSTRASGSCPWSPPSAGCRASSRRSPRSPRCSPPRLPRSCPGTPVRALRARSSC